MKLSKSVVSSLHILFALLLVSLVSSCSLHQYQKEGDLLYVGIKDIKIEQSKVSSPNKEAALLAAETQLSYAPNNAILGSSTMRFPLPLYRPYLYLKYADSETFVGKWLHRLGNKPTWLRDVNPKLRAEVTKRIFAEYGYLGASVRSELIPQRDSLQTKVSYHIDMGEQYVLDSVSYLPNIPLTDSTVFVHAEQSKVYKGVPYSIDLLSRDRLAISQRLREDGYYFFSPQYVVYELDSLQRSGALQLRSVLQKSMPEQVMKQWHIGRVHVRFIDDMVGQNTLSSDELRIDTLVTAHFTGKLPIRPRVLNTRLRLRPDSLYRFSLEDLTIKSLASIGSFSGTEVVYTPREVDSLQPNKHIMDMTVLMRRDKPWNVMLGGQFMHKSTDFIGPGMIFTLARRNLFGGGESLSLSATGSYEWQTGRNPFAGASYALNSYHLGADASLTFPTLLIPGRFDAYYAFPTTTTFRLSGQHLNRAGYYGLSTLSFNVNYDFQPSYAISHSITPLSLDYTQLSHTTATFRSILEANPSLSLSLSSQFIPSIGYTFTWQKTLDDRGDTRLWWRSSIKESGNLIKGASLLLGHKFGETRHLLGVPYAQFTRFSSEVRLTRIMNRKQGFALRTLLGAIYSYGNMKVAPYTEQFYIGGASSIRAFTVRSLGPGKFKAQGSLTNYSFMDHVGEFKFEFNGEYRHKFSKELELAFFLDAGNIWLLRPDAERPGGALSEVGSFADLLNQVAVGTGAGIRYDFGYLMIRLDAGIGLHLPYKTSRSGWYNIPSFSDGFGLHLAIGYPF